jgi:hypothetical protein
MLPKPRDPSVAIHERVDEEKLTVDDRGLDDSWERRFPRPPEQVRHEARNAGGWRRNVRDLRAMQDSNTARSKPARVLDEAAHQDPVSLKEIANGEGA